VTAIYSTLTTLDLDFTWLCKTKENTLLAASIHEGHRQNGFFHCKKTNNNKKKEG